MVNGFGIKLPDRWDNNEKGFIAWLYHIITGH